MKNTMHRVVILNNVKSEIISQAILILKNPEGVCESAVLEEAERVVEKYMQNMLPESEKSDGRLLFSLICTAFLAFVGVCVFAIFKFF